MANKNFKVRQGLEAPLIAADDGTTAITISNSTGNIALAGSLDVQGGTITDSTGALSITTGAGNGAITLTPNGSGTVIVSSDLAVNGATSADITTTTTTASVFNTTATTVNVSGAATTTNIGAKTGSSIINGTNRFTSPVIYQLAGAVNHRGLMISNGNAGSVASARNAILMRTFPTAGGARGGLFYENARGTESVPTAIQSADLIGEVSITGYATNNYVTNLVSATPGAAFFVATENWADNGAGTVTNAGTGYQIACYPTATNLQTANAGRITILNANPQTFASRSDAYTWSQGKTGSTQNMALDVNGNLAVTGDLTVTGNDIKSSGGTTAISLNGTDVSVAGELTVGGDLRINGNDIRASNNATNISLVSNSRTDFAGDIRIGGNDIEGSGGSKAIELSSANTFIQMYSDVINLKDAAGNNGVIINNAAKTINISSGSTDLLQVGDVNIAQFGSTWQSVYSPGFKYTGLASSSTLTNNGTAFEMSSRWKASSGTSTFDPPQTNWGIGAFQFSADASTNNTNQKNAGQIRVAATENWDATHFGTRITLDANALGTGGSKQVASLSPETSLISSDIITLENQSGVDYAVLNSTSATFTVPVGFPVYTIAGKPATGVVGQQISISDSPTSGGRMAFWDTTNARWSYIHDNSAV